MIDEFELIREPKNWDSYNGNSGEFNSVIFDKIRNNQINKGSESRLAFMTLAFGILILLVVFV